MPHVAGYVPAPPLRLPFSGSEVLSVECSRAGAESAKERASRQALTLMAEYAKGRLTDHEMHERTGLAISVICARRGELRRLQLIKGWEKVPGPFGNPNTKWGLVGESKGDTDAEAVGEV